MAGGNGGWAATLSQKPTSSSGRSVSIQAVKEDSVSSSALSGNVVSQTTESASTSIENQAHEEFNSVEVRQYLHDLFQNELALAKANGSSTVVYKLLELNNPWQLNDKSSKDKAKTTRFDLISEINKSLAKRPATNTRP